MMKKNSKLFLVLLIVAYLFSARLWGWRQEQPEMVSAESQSVEMRALRQVPAGTWLRPEPMGKFYSTNYPEDISAEAIASVICEYATYMWNSPLTHDECLMIVRECQGMNVNCLWPAAIAAHESHLGAHRSAYEKGNLWGIDKSNIDAGLSDLGTLQNGAREVSQILAWYYFDEGRLTFQTLEKKYASQITPPNGGWAKRVRDFYEDLAAELAQQTDPSAPVGIPVVQRDDPIQTWNPYYPVLEARARVHRGVDIIAGNPDEVWLRSTLSGKVVYSGLIHNLPSFRITFTGSADQNSYSVRELDVTGWTVVIENEHWQTIMGHGAEQPLVAVGETVARGDWLMLMGATGYVKGENPRHVHYGIRYRLPSGEWRFVKP